MHRRRGIWWCSGTLWTTRRRRRSRPWGRKLLADHPLLVYHPKVQDMGSVYCGIAGMLNLLVVFDVLLRITGWKRKDPEQARRERRAAANGGPSAAGGAGAAAAGGGRIDSLMCVHSFLSLDHGGVSQPRWILAVAGDSAGDCGERGLQGDGGWNICGTSAKRRW